jgi:thioredoxin 1
MKILISLRNRRNLLLKIGVPVLLIAVIMCIWAVKNSSGNVNDVNSKNSDFALHVTNKIDLEKLKSC